MNTEVFNVVISSKNKVLTSDTNSSLLVKLKEDIFVDNDEELHVSLSSFNMIKSFYACQPGLNNYFKVLFKLPNESIAIETFDIYLSEGNYDVKTLVQEIKKQTNNALFDITYDSKLNKYLYKNLFQPQFEVWIKPINAGIFLGFENGQEYKILATGTYSSKFINISGYTSMILKIQSGMDITNTISNIYKADYQYDKILSILSVGDIAPMDSITYLNNGDNLFKHRVSNQKISSFRIQIANEDGNEFTNMSNWIMILKFEKVKNYNPDLSAMTSVLNDIRYYVMSFYSYVGVPSKITYEDLIQR